MDRPQDTPVLIDGAVFVFGRRHKAVHLAAEQLVERGMAFAAAHRAQYEAVGGVDSRVVARKGFDLRREQGQSFRGVFGRIFEVIDVRALPGVFVKHGVGIAAHNLFGQGSGLHRQFFIVPGGAKRLDGLIANGQPIVKSGDICVRAIIAAGMHPLPVLEASQQVAAHLCSRRILLYGRDQRLETAPDGISPGFRCHGDIRLFFFVHQHDAFRMRLQPGGGRIKRYGQDDLCVGTGLRNGMENRQRVVGRDPMLRPGQRGFRDKPVETDRLAVFIWDFGCRLLHFGAQKLWLSGPQADIDRRFRPDHRLWDAYARLFGLLHHFRQIGQRVLTGQAPHQATGPETQGCRRANTHQSEKNIDMDRALFIASVFRHMPL